MPKLARLTLTFSPSGEKAGMRGRLGQKTGNLLLASGAFQQRVPNLKPDGFQFTAQLVIPKAQHANPLVSKKGISLFILRALVGKTVAATVEFHRELGGGAVEIEEVAAAGILPAEFELAETAVAEQTPQALLGIGGFFAKLTREVASFRCAGAMLAVVRRAPPHPILLPRGGEGVRLGG